MPRDLYDGESCEMQGSGAKPYILKNVGGVYSCSCPSWRNQSLPISQRTCKHLRKLRGDAAEDARIGSAPSRAATTKKDEWGAFKDTKTVPALLLAQSWDGVLDPTGWWMSEKLDGVRALWKDKKFITRQGNIYLAPEWFTRGMTENTLDGELWIGRGQFQKTVSIVRRHDGGEQWGEVRFLVFDAPASGGTFETRMKAVAALVQGSPYTKAHPHTIVQSIAHVKEELARIEALGGEGLCLRKPGSLYEIGKSMTLLKVKSFYDSEATVTGYQKGKGRHKGRMGSLELKWEDGTPFEIGTGFSDAERENPPAIGTIIKFKYQKLSDDGVPQMTSYIGLRED